MQSRIPKAAMILPEAMQAPLEQRQAVPVAVPGIRHRLRRT
jgi:hypothetical protein